MDLKNHWSDDGTGGALRREGPLMAGPALSRKERGWEESLVTAPSAASGGLVVRMMGLLPAQVALSIVQRVEARSFGRFSEGTCLGSGQETCVMGTRVQGRCSLWTLAAPALGRVIHEASAPGPERAQRYRRELVSCSRVQRGPVPRGCLKEARITWEHLPRKLPSSSPSTYGPGSASCRGSSRGGR